MRFLITVLLIITFATDNCIGQDAKKDNHTLGTLSCDAAAIQIQKTPISMRFTLMLPGDLTPDGPIRVVCYSSKKKVLAFTQTNKPIDAATGDGVESQYLATLEIQVKELDDLIIQASAIVAGQRRVAEMKLKVTLFPVGLAEIEEDCTAFDKKSGQMIVSNEIIVSFKEGTTDKEIAKIFESLKLVVVGSIPELRVLQIRLPKPGSVQEVYRAIEKLSRFKEVEYAEPNGLATVQAPKES